jgi:E3 ubiquitin-protein ligase RNF13
LHLLAGRGNLRRPDSAQRHIFSALLALAATDRTETLGMPYRNLDPTAAKALLDDGTGWVYVDVRTTGEFDQGHPAGARNVPLFVGTPPRMALNPEFLAVMLANFKKDAKLVMGCASGMRSAKACEVLANAGFRELVNMSGGFVGARDPLGRVEKGWSGLGFPSESGAAPERDYESLRRKV